MVVKLAACNTYIIKKMVSKKRSVVFELKRNEEFTVGTGLREIGKTRPYKVQRLEERITVSNYEKNQQVIKSLELAAHVNAKKLEASDKSEAVMCVLGRMRYSRYRSLWIETGNVAKFEDGS